MKIFNFKKKKEEKVIVADANKIMEKAIIDKALQENQEKANKIKTLERKNRKLTKDINIMLNNAEECRTKIDNLENNIEVLNNTIEKLKEICHNAKGNTVSKKKILNELGE